jgi:hypothetical protein
MSKDELIGSWESDVADRVRRSNVGKARMEFFPDGTLAYVTFDNDKMQIFKLTYKVDGNTLITDQPSSPRSQINRFEIRGRSLRLLNDSEWSLFKKVD